MRNVSEEPFIIARGALRKREVRVRRPAVRVSERRIVLAPTYIANRNVQHALQMMASTLQKELKKIGEKGRFFHTAPDKRKREKEGERERKREKKRERERRGRKRKKRGRKGGRDIKKER